MTKAEAKRIIVSEWLELPVDERATEDQAAVFAMKAQGRYRWRAGGDHYQQVMGWLSAHHGED